MYDTLGFEAFDHILKITEGTLLFTTSDLADNLWNYLKQNKHNLKQICFFDKVSEESRNKLVGLGVKVNLFEEIASFNKIQKRPQLNLDT